MAQMLALAGRAGASGPAADNAQANAQAAGGAPEGAAQGGGRGPGGQAGRGARGGDLQQVLGRLPASTLADLQKGDAVMIVSTEGTASDGVTAITVLAGVEPLLQSNGGQSMSLPPWNLGGGGDEPAAE
jgi:hypothetical protein